MREIFIELCQNFEMPKKCAVVGCSTNRHHFEQGIRFYHIPRENEHLKVRWLDAIGRSTEWTIPPVPIICEKHFVQEQKVSARNLAPNVIPTLNLPSPEDAQSGSHPRTVQPAKTSVKRKAKTKTKDLTILEPEIVLVPTVVDAGNDYCESYCRFCSDELKVTDGLHVVSLRQSGLVRDAIWDLCWPRANSMADNDDLNLNICNVCWLKMKEFDHFVTICHQQQETLSRTLEKKPVKFDVMVEDQLTNVPEETANLFTESQISNPENVEHEAEPSVEETNSELPSLEGLTIDEMLELLDRIPTPRKKYNQLNEDEECWDCGKMFPNRSQKKEHRKTCPAIGTSESLRNKSHTCEICGRQFDSRHGYRMHLQKIHKNEEMGEENASQELKRMMSKKRLMCPLCPDRFEQLHMLKYHLKTHKTKSLGNVKVLRRKRDPNSINNYCQLCDKTFQNPSYLELHMKFHKRERDFDCDRCDKRFFIAQDLKHHKMAVHEAHTILCGECGKTFGTQRYFKRHMLIHSTDPSLRPFKCSHCSETFHTAAKLKNHLTRHTGEKIHQCVLCDQAFRFRHQLTRHKISKHGMQLDRQLLVDTRKEVTKEEPADSGEYPI